ncbi:MAG: cryptochrome/photolyase family protein, partial [Caldilineaceae bacterium]
AFLYAGLRALDDELRRHGGRLIVRHGTPIDVLSSLMAECGASQIVAQEDYSPYARRRDEQVARGVPLTLTPGTLVHHPDAVRKADGGAYTVYSPFRRKWLALTLPHPVGEPPVQLSVPNDIQSDPIPEPESTPWPPAGEHAAQELLDHFTTGPEAPIYRYAEDRDRVDLEGTSRLSPYLRFGMISARKAVDYAVAAADRASIESAADGPQTWLDELIWREFYTGILFHFPEVRSHSFREKYRQIRWANNKDDFEAWCAGQTGYPLVDAAMRQLAQTGWMHNRARMIVASFLTKDLLIDWRWGEEWFMQHLVDGDPAANNGGWQWSAGTGTDAAPYFRIFNPVSQSKRCDPAGDYIRKHVPELRTVPDKYLHEPWKMPAGVQQSSGCIIGKTYPEPVVDHKWARERALTIYAEAKA